jgi:hypothetical protein
MPVTAPSYERLEKIIRDAWGSHDVMMASLSNKIERYVSDRNRVSSTNCGSSLLRKWSHLDEFLELFGASPSYKMAFGTILKQHLGSAWSMSSDPRGYGKIYRRKHPVAGLKD